MDQSIHSIATDERIALICGLSGQDGGYLAKMPLDKGYEVFGTSRDAQGSSLLRPIDLAIGCVEPW